MSSGGSRHATSDQVTLAESETEYNEGEEDEPLPPFVE